MNKYKFDLANMDDVSEIVEIYHGLIGTPGCAWDYEYPSRESAESDIDCKSLYVLKRDTRIIAIASAGEFNELEGLSQSLKKPCELMRFGVLSALRKQGIGTVLLQNVIKEMKEKGYDGIELLVSKTNPAAIALYEKNGFERLGEVFRFDIDFYFYQLIFDFR